MPVFFPHRKQDVSNFHYIPRIINCWIEEACVGAMYSTLQDSDQGYRSPHTSQTVYFSYMNENKISDRETPVQLLSWEPQ